jgi:hypothetical protein
MMHIVRKIRNENEFESFIGNITKVDDVIHVAASYIFDQNFGVCNDTGKDDSS